MKRIIIIIVGCFVLAAVSITAILLVNSKSAPAPLQSGVVYDATKSAVESAPEQSISLQADKSELTFGYTQMLDGSSVGNVDIYLDADKNKYLFNDKGEQIGFMASGKGAKAYSTYSENINLDKAVEIADNVLREIAGNNRDYTMTEAKYFDNMDVYSVSYHYFVDGYKTSDFAFVDISPKGEIVTYAAPNIGLFDGVIVPEINKSEIEKTVADYITQTYDCKDYSIDGEITIDKTDDGFEISVPYSVTLSNGALTADIYYVILN